MSTDIAFLDPDQRVTAVRTSSGEVMWPASEVTDVLCRLTERGHSILGLDLRSDAYGPSDLPSEIPLYDSEGASADESLRVALAALADDHTQELVHKGYSHVLVTW